MPRVLHILEPALARESGHFPTLLRAVVAAARSNFGSIRIYAHHAVEVSIEGAEVVPMFRRRVRRFTVMRLCASLLRRDDATIFFNTASNSDFVGLRRALFFSPRPRARVVVFRHAHYPSPKGERWMASVARKLPAVVLACPTKACCDDMRRVGFTNVQEIPYPHVELPRPAERAVGPVRVVLPGVPRIDKGLPEVAALAERLAQRGADIPLVVQASKDHWGEDQPGVGEVLDRLKRSPYKHLELVGDRPDPADFAALFEGAVVLVPYDPVLFKDRISGITLDALRFGCPVITTAGTWMARQVEPFGAGEVLHTRSPEELEAAIRTVLADLPRYREGARRAGARVVQEQAASPLATLLAGI